MLVNFSYFSFISTNKHRSFVYPMVKFTHIVFARKFCFEKGYVWSNSQQNHKFQKAFHDRTGG